MFKTHDYDEFIKTFECECFFVRLKEGFSEKFEIEEKLDDKLAEYMYHFFNTKHVKRDIELTKKVYQNWKDRCYRSRLGVEGEYFVDHYTQEKKEDILNEYEPPAPLPECWCCLRIERSDKDRLIWRNDLMDSAMIIHRVRWIKYVLDNFLVPNGYTVNGEMRFQANLYREYKEELYEGKIKIENSEIKIKLLRRY